MLVVALRSPNRRFDMKGRLYVLLASLASVAAVAAFMKGW
jgi:hypothetical protein